MCEPERPVEPREPPPPVCASCGRMATIYDSIRSVCLCADCAEDLALQRFLSLEQPDRLELMCCEAL